MFRAPWRKAGTGTGPGMGMAAGWSRGKRSGGFGTGTRIAGEEEEPAAWATRSHTWREDCWEEREAVACLASRTRPVVIAA